MTTCSAGNGSNVRVRVESSGEVWVGSDVEWDMGEELGKGLL